MAQRVCLVRHSYYPHDMLVRREAIALRDYGFQVQVFCLRGQGQAANEVIDGVEVYRVPLSRVKGGAARYLYDYLTFFAFIAVRLAIRHLHHQYACIQVNTMPDFLVFATLIARLLGAKVTLMMYEPMPELWATVYRQRLVVKLLEATQRAAIGYAHAVFAVTEQQKETFVARGANADKITVLLNVPETRFWEQSIPAALSPNEHFTLICHGAIEERYGHDTMLQAIQQVKDQIPNLRLRILGTGSYKDQFQAQIKEMNLEEYVQYLGWVPLQQMAEELHNADVGIVAQKSSLYSNLVHTGKMYDFLAFGKPVLASRLKAVQAYFGEEALRFFEPGDADSLAEGILDLYQHPEKRKMLIENSQRLYEQYKWENQKQVYLSVYRALVA
jgi:glycosyltransferase involved in cell wall biosynthesis